MMENIGYITLGMLGTLVITASSFVIGGLLGIPLATGRLSRLKSIRWLSGTYIEIFRAVPNLVWLFLVFFGLPELGIRLNAWVAAIVAFSVTSTAYAAEIYRGGYAGIDRGQWEAANALGLNRWSRNRDVILPQLGRVVGPTMATHGLSVLKESSLASTIGVMELTFRGGIATQRTGEGLSIFVLVGVLYMIMGLPLGFASRHVDNRLRAKYSIG